MRLDPVFLEYDPSPLHLVHTMLDEANLKKSETFLDLYVPIKRSPAVEFVVLTFLCFAVALATVVG